MIPLALDPIRVRVALAGQGPLARRRLAQLRDGGADPVVYAPAPDPDFTQFAGNALVNSLPTDADLAGVRVLFVVGLEDAQAQALAGRAQALGILVNVEDVVPLCDFHVPSLVRRGDLLLTVSTGGKSPALAQLVRERLESLFPAAWAERLVDIAALRDRLRADGASGPAILRATRDFVTGKGWL